MFIEKRGQEIFDLVAFSVFSEQTFLDVSPQTLAALNLHMLTISCPFQNHHNYLTGRGTLTCITAYCSDFMNIQYYIWLFASQTKVRYVTMETAGVQN